MKWMNEKMIMTSSANPCMCAHALKEWVFPPFSLQAQGMCELAAPSNGPLMKSDWQRAHVPCAWGGFFPPFPIQAQGSRSCF